MKSSGEKSYHSPALERGLNILEYLCQNPEGKPFSEIYTNLGVPRTTAFTLLRSLIDNGYVRKDAAGFFHASLKVYSLGMEAARHLKKNELLLPDLTALRNELGCTVHALVYANEESIVLEKLDGTGAISFKSYVGERKSLHLSAAGKAILSYLPDDEFAFYAKGDLKRLTENSLCTKEQLVECRRQVREKGHSVDNEESEPGVFCLGVPIFTVDGGLLGAISVSSLKTLMDEKRQLECNRHIIQAGESISRKMGYTGQYPIIYR